MSCKQCGRDDGHWLGCDRAPGHVSRETKKDLDDVSRETSPQDQCQEDGCTNAKASKHPRARYCEEHKPSK